MFPLDLDDAAIVDRLRELEVVKARAEAEQAALAALLDDRVRAREAETGVPAARLGRGVAAQVALARRESLTKGQRHLALAKVLPAELPHTWAAFCDGRVTEWRATLVARETACLSRDDRRAVDAELASDPERIEHLGDGELVAEARRIAYRLDPHAVVERRRRAEADRHVSLRPAPDVMAQLSALLPVKDGVGVLAALRSAADTAVAAGDERSRSQIMADTLVSRVTGSETATSGAATAVCIDVVVPDSVLMGQSDEAAHLDGYGPIPADLARELAGGATWLRRLYATPETGRLVSMDSRCRGFPATLARFVRLRDRTCRLPWCDAPVRHTDHVVEAARGGPTSAANGQGLCEAHNHARQAPGWRASPPSGGAGPHRVGITTPTGHTYVSTAPAARRPAYTQVAPGRWTRTDLLAG